MVFMIIIPMKNGYFIGNINPTFSDKPIYRDLVWPTISGSPGLAAIGVKATVKALEKEQAGQGCTVSWLVSWLKGMGTVDNEANQSWDMYVYIYISVYHIHTYIYIYKDTYIHICIYIWDKLG